MFILGCKYINIFLNNKIIAEKVGKFEFFLYFCSTNPRQECRIKKHIRNMELLLLLLLLGLFGGSKKKDKKKRRRRRKDDDSWLDYAWFHDHDQQI